MEVVPAAAAARAAAAAGTDAELVGTGPLDEIEGHDMHVIGRALRDFRLEVRVALCGHEAAHDPGRADRPSAGVDARDAELHVAGRHPGIVVDVACDHRLAP